MRNAVPMRWIEQAEAREILAASRFQLPQVPSWQRKARAAAIRRLRRLGACCSRWCQCDWLPTARPQPVLVRTAAHGAPRHRV